MKFKIIFGKVIDFVKKITFGINELTNKGSLLLYRLILLFWELFSLLLVFPFIILNDVRGFINKNCWSLNYNIMKD